MIGLRIPSCAICSAVAGETGTYAETLTVREGKGEAPRALACPGARLVDMPTVTLFGV